MIIYNKNHNFINLRNVKKITIEGYRIIFTFNLPADYESWIFENNYDLQKVIESIKKLSTEV